MMSIQHRHSKRIIMWELVVAFVLMSFIISGLLLGFFALVFAIIELIIDK